jgi:hypothetical protein
MTFFVYFCCGAEFAIATVSFYPGCAFNHSTKREGDLIGMGAMMTSLHQVKDSRGGFILRYLENRSSISVPTYNSMRSKWPETFLCYEVRPARTEVAGQSGQAMLVR